MKINIGVSNRHVHLKQDDLEVLFGEGYSLTKYRDLTQTGEFASQEKLSIKTDKDIIDNVRVLGPIRSYTQVEISLTDAYKLGLKPPVRDSGDLIDSEDITLIGPKGELKVKNCCIIASRHIHINNIDRKNLGLDGIDMVSVKIDGIKGGILDNVNIKENDSYVFELHIDTDDANAHMIKNGDVGEIIIK